MDIETNTTPNILRGSISQPFDAIAVGTSTKALVE
jgi:hypothetical protein